MAESPRQGDEFLRGDDVFELHSFREGSAQIIVVVGELDVSTAGQLATGFAQAEATSAIRIVLDLRRLEFIDSSGLDVIDAAHHRVHERLVLVKGPRQVQRPFELCGLVGLLTWIVRPPQDPAVPPPTQPPSREEPSG